MTRIGKEGGYKIRLVAGSIIVTIDRTFLRARGLAIGDAVYPYLTEDNDLLISPDWDLAGSVNPSARTGAR